MPHLPAQWVISTGVINGRNVWRANLAKLAPTLKALKAKLGERLWVASSCSLLHSPVDLTLEQELDPQTRSWFAFALQKCFELGLLKEYLDGGELDKITAYSQPIVDRESDSRVHKKAVQSRLASLTNSDFDRHSPYPVRAELQRSDLKLPLLPTTTIGSFPQTSQIRVLRQDWRAGRIDDSAYEAGIKAEIPRCHRASGGHRAGRAGTWRGRAQ